MAGMISSFRQFFFPAAPRFTEKDVPDMTNKVVIVTGSNSGLGKEIAQILYSKNARVYMMARSEQKTQQAIDSIKAAFPKSHGEMHFIRLDLSDLAGIKASTDEFLRRESQLHVLFNNAGVGYPEKGSKTKQGYETILGVNCVGPFAFTKLLTRILVSTAKLSPRDTVRVVWVSSSAAEGYSPNGYMDLLPNIGTKNQVRQYCFSKLGNYFHATEFAARFKGDGVVSIPLNPGALDSEFWSTQAAFMRWLLRKTLLYPIVYGAYTCLFAGFSPEVTLEKSGNYVAPWGQLWKVSNEMLDAAKPSSEGGSGLAEQFWEWSDVQVQRYV